MTPEEFARVDPQLACALRAFAGSCHAIDGVYQDTDAAQQKEETMVQRPHTNREIASAAEARLLESVRLTIDASLALQSLPFTMPQVTDALHDARRALDRAAAMLAQVIVRMPP